MSSVEKLEKIKQTLQDEKKLSSTKAKDETLDTIKAMYEGRALGLDLGIKLIENAIEYIIQFKGE